MGHVKTEKTDVVILCGGLGKRLKKVVRDRPKSMAEIKGRPFLDILIDYVASFGFRRFILCTGYMGDHIDKYFVRGKERALDILFSRERKPLGNRRGGKERASLHQKLPIFSDERRCHL